MTRAQRFSIWLTKHLPAFLILEPERAFMGFAALLVGLTAFWTPTRSASLQQAYDEFFVLLWGVALITGGLFKLTGLIMSSRVRSGKSIEYEQKARLAERTGATFIALGAALYAWVAFSAYGLNVLISVAIFSAMAIANALRIVISTAGRTILNRAGGEGHDVA